MSTVVERIRRYVQQATPYIAEPRLSTVAEAVQRVAEEYSSQRWKRLAELLRLDASMVERVCNAQPEWCDWIERIINGEHVPAPINPPSMEIATLIERGTQLGYTNLVGAVSLKELTKRVAELIKRHEPETVKHAEEAVKMLRNLYGARAEHDVVAELRGQLTAVLPAENTEKVAKIVTRAIVEAPTPSKAVERIAEIAKAIRAGAEAEARQQTQLRQIAPEAKEAKPLRPSVEVKKVG